MPPSNADTGGVTDEDLAARAAAGDEPAFTALIRRLKEPAYRFARLHTGDPDEAYDVVQEAFVSAWKNLARYDPSRRFSTWLFQITLNKCRDRARRRKVRQFFYQARDLDHAANRADAGMPDPEQQLGTGQQAARLEAEIGALPEGLRSAFVLAAVEQHSHQETAAILGISPKSVEMRVYRARKHLQARLENPDA